jgi:hypothetical protein
MALSPNYGFPEPDNSSLVKNGAQDIRALGDAIDAFLFRPFTKNGVINGAMDNWQRGTSFVGTTTNTYCADRWIAYRNAAGSTFTRQTAGLTGFLYGTRVQRDSGNTSTSVIYLSQMFESQESYKYAGQTVTLSWYAKAGANFSAASSQMIARIYTGTGTDQNWIQTGYTGQAITLDNLTTITTSYVRYSATVVIPSATTELSVTLGFTPVGTAGANDWVEITGVQLEVGSQVSPFTRAGGTLQGELAACQRYYFRYKPEANAVRNFGQGTALSATVTLMNVVFPVTMRIRPTAIEQSGTAADYVAMTAAGGQNALTAVPAFDGITTDRLATLVGTTTGMVAGDSTYLFSANGNAYLGWSAEL